MRVLVANYHEHPPELGIADDQMVEVIIPIEKTVKRTPNWLEIDYREGQKILKKWIRYWYKNMRESIICVDKSKLKENNINVPVPSANNLRSIKSHILTQLESTIRRTVPDLDEHIEITLSFELQRDIVILSKEELKKKYPFANIDAILQNLHLNKIDDDGYTNSRIIITFDEIKRLITKRDGVYISSIAKKLKVDKRIVQVFVEYYIKKGLLQYGSIKRDGLEIPSFSKVKLPNSNNGKQLTLETCLIN